MAMIEEHVTEGEADLGRRAQRPSVIALGEQPTAPTEHPVQATRQSNLQADHPAGQAVGTASLDDEMKVIGLHAELDDAKVGPMPAIENRPPNHPHRPMSAK